MLTYSGILISELQEVSGPGASDVIVLNVNDEATRKVTYSSLLNDVRFKVVVQSDWSVTNPTSPAFILNKPNVYIANIYIPSLPSIL